MAWIESHQELLNHPKRKRLTRLLSLDVRGTIGLLHMLWWWAYDYAPEGDLSSFSDDDLADAIAWEGDPGEMVSALTQAGFLNADRTIHDWWDHAQKWIERRRRDAERKRAGRTAASSGDADSTGRPVDVHRTSERSPYVTGPDRTGPDLTPDRTPTPKSPPHSGGDLAPAAAVARPSAAAKGERRSQRNGAAAVAERPAAPVSPDDVALWQLAVEDIAGQENTGPWRSNVENFIAPLAVAGRGTSGGLQLRAPPYAKQRAQGYRQIIVLALERAGDQHARHVAIVE